MVNTMNRFLISLFLLTLVVSAISGCATAGREFPTMFVSEIKIGQTTREEILNLFGEPWRTGVEDGKKTWTYGHYRYSLFESEQTRDLVIRFDEQGKVSSFTYNSTYPEDKVR